MTCKDCIHYEACEDFTRHKLSPERAKELLPILRDKGRTCEHFKDRSRFVELPDDFPKGRLTTDNPLGNFDALMNYAYAKDGNVMLSYGAGKNDIDLVSYVLQKVDEGICPAESEEDIIEGCCLECENECQLGILYFVAVQAAELRARLKMYEDLAERALKGRENNG